METFYLFLIIFLFVLAVFDLSVGVSNDAVNFMNSAIGSKAASFKVNAARKSKVDNNTARMQSIKQLGV